MRQDMFEVCVQHGRAVVVRLGLEYFPASLETAGKHDLLAEVDLGIGVLDASMLFLDVGVVCRVEVEGEVAAATQLACPLGVGGVDLVEMPLEIGFPAYPLADAILDAEGTL
jgi:hypothetical protein